MGGGQPRRAAADHDRTVKNRFLAGLAAQFCYFCFHACTCRSRGAMSVIGATFGRFPAFGKTLPESDPIWQMESMAIRRGTAPLYCRNLLLTIDVRPFLSNAADTPATGNNDVGREPDRTANGPVVQASPGDYLVSGDYLVWRHDAVRQNREKPS